MPLIVLTFNVEIVAFVVCDVEKKAVLNVDGKGMIPLIELTRKSAMLATFPTIVLSVALSINVVPPTVEGLISPAYKTENVDIPPPIPATPVIELTFNVLIDTTGACMVSPFGEHISSKFAMLTTR